MNQFRVTELDNDIFEMEATGDPGQLAIMINQGMREKEDFRNIILTAVVVWAKDNSIDLNQMMRAAMQNIPE